MGLVQTEDHILKRGFQNHTIIKGRRRNRNILAKSHPYVAGDNFPDYKVSTTLDLRLPS